jgi:hypothetical protein
MTTQIQTKTNNQWYAFADLGSYFRLQDSALLQKPMLAGGTEGADDESATVDWDRGVDATDRERLLDIIKQLNSRA